MEYLFIILFIYASYLSIEKYVHTGSIFTWRGRKDRKERRATPVTIHPAASSSETEIIGKSRYQIRQSLTIDDKRCAVLRSRLQPFCASSIWRKYAI